jgi:hypothetical protein
MIRLNYRLARFFVGKQQSIVGRFFLDWKAVFFVSNERSRICEKGSLRRILSGNLKEFPDVLLGAIFSDYYSSCIKSYNKQ